MDCTQLIDMFGGNFKKPIPQTTNWSLKTQSLIDRSLEGIDQNHFQDIHFHTIGTGTNNSGIWINPEFKQLLKPKKFLQYHIYQSASGVSDTNENDKKHLENSLKLISQIPNYKVHLLAFDYFYAPEGNRDLAQSSFYVPNQYVYDLAQKNPDHFIPAISIHPYRSHAIKELEKWSKLGVRLVKWLPNAMGIDPASTKLIPFYKALLRNRMTLMINTGEEHQSYGNPAHLRLPLDMGVKVVMAHAASLGTCKHP